MRRTRQTARKSSGGRAPRTKRQASQEISDRLITPANELEEDSDDGAVESSTDLEGADRRRRDEDSIRVGSDAARETDVDGEAGDATDSDHASLNDHSFEVFPKVSIGGVFADDLQHVLSGKSDLAGDFSHFQLTPSAPNPCLTVEGLGCMWVPLSSRDATAITPHAEDVSKSISKASKEKLWAFDASQVTFNNSEWKQFVHDAVVNTVWDGLGIMPNAAPIKCELHKLLMFGPESGQSRRRGRKSSQPTSWDLAAIGHPAGENSTGVFANILIQLPSSFSGGNVRVSYDAQNRDINLDEKPFVTSILASYTGVKYHFAPITNGYRLALLYNLTCGHLDIQPALATETLMLRKLRHVLQQWMDSSYEDAGDSERFVYVLGPVKAPVKGYMRRGQQTILKFSELSQRLVSCLQQAADDLGLMVFTGQLEWRDHGVSDVGVRDSDRSDDDYNPSGIGVSMEELEETTIRLDDLVDEEGDLVDGAYIGLDEEEIIPGYPFTDAKPDCKSYCSELGTVDYYFYREAVLVTTLDGTKEVFDGAYKTYWLSKLEKQNSATATEHDLTMAKIALKKLTDSQYDQPSRDRLMRIAMKWKDLGLWGKILQKCGKGVTHYNVEMLGKAFNTFSFNALRPIFEKMLQDTPSSQDRLEFLRRLSRCSSPSLPEEVMDWCKACFSKIQSRASTSSRSAEANEKKRKPAPSGSRGNHAAASQISKKARTSQYVDHGVIELTSSP